MLSTGKNHDLFKIYDPYEKILVEVLGFNLNIQCKEYTKYNASVNNICAVIINYNHILRNVAIDEYVELTPKKGGNVKIEINDVNLNIQGDHKKKYTTTTYCDEFAIGPITVTEDRKTMMLGDRYILHTINSKTKLFMTELFSFTNSTDTIIGVSFGWPIKYSELQQNHMWLKNTINILPILEHSMCGRAFVMVKAAQDLIISNAELSNIHCIQLKCDIIFNADIIENLLSRIIIDYKTDKIGDVFGNPSFNQFLEEDHTHLMELVIDKYFKDIKKLPHIIESCDIHSINLLKIHIMSIATIVGIENKSESYPLLPLLISTIVKGEDLLISH